MANLSDAYGIIKIEADNPESIKSLLRTFSEESGWEYATFIDEPDNPIKKLSDWKYRFESSFSGVGRYAYQSNVKKWAEWHKDSPESKFLESKYWVMRFEYSDYEPGCNVLYDEVDLLLHESGKPMTETLFRLCSDRTYPCTLKNVMEKGFEGDFRNWVEFRTDTYRQTRREARQSLYDEYGEQLLEYFGSKEKAESSLDEVLNDLPFKEPEVKKEGFCYA